MCEGIGIGPVFVGKRLSGCIIEKVVILFVLPCDLMSCHEKSCVNGSTSKKTNHDGMALDPGMNYSFFRADFPLQV